MSLPFSERLTVVAPTLLFLLSIVWGELFRGKLVTDLNRVEAAHELRFRLIAGKHLMAVEFADSIVLSIINGLILILELNMRIEGVLILLCGISLSITGLICVLVDTENLHVNLWMITLMYAGAEMGFLSGVDVTTGNPTVDLFVPYVGACIGVLLISGIFAAIVVLIMREIPNMNFMRFINYLAHEPAPSNQTDANPNNDSDQQNSDHNNES
ncbi:MAG TPA: hypothetical protein VJZ32_03915 [Candidatus Bathyarchaeia archaeon]|nr:hypothetical protein [Candidatus Bathyarchaeia archaeon]